MLTTLEEVLIFKLRFAFQKGSNMQGRRKKAFQAGSTIGAKLLRWDGLSLACSGMESLKYGC